MTSDVLYDMMIDLDRAAELCWKLHDYDGWRHYVQRKADRKPHLIAIMDAEARS